MSMNRHDWMKILGILGGGGLIASGVGAPLFGKLLGMGATAAGGAIPAMSEYAGVANAANGAGLLGSITGAGKGALEGMHTASKVAAPMQAMGLIGGPPPQPMAQQSRPAPVPPMQQPMKPLYPPAGEEQLPPELAGLPPNDPRVMEWKMKQRMNGGFQNV